ncbi:MAG: hypothetical protein R3F41_07670 [Gammaproteobacteria bacterium]|nr:hypothetical protein [Pseudomonadales bacterium]MCP5349320.1 hypothetical protein [Pseudomonadales bacterium]
MSKLSEAVGKLGDHINDLSELRVQTVTGDVKAVISKNKLSDLQDLLKPSGTASSSTASLNLVLDTTIAFDGDSLNFIDTDLATEEVTSIHREALESGLNQRKAIVEMFKSLLN